MTSRTVSKSACAAGGGDRPCCTPAPDSFASLQAVIDDYRAEYGHRVDEEAAYFGDRDLTIAEAICRAARSELADGSVHGHQRRPGREVMQRCVAALAGHEEIFADAPDFAAVHASVGRILEPVYGAGALIVYDIAERIGWRLGIEPEQVYLHCGAGDGARVLRPDLRGKTAKAGELAPALAQLPPAHVENLLCIYKGALESLRARGLV